MTVLLTGGGGFVGHHTLAHFLKTTDYQFVVTDSFRHRGSSARLRSVFDEIPSASSRVKVITHDLTTPIDSVTAKQFGKVKYVISMASESHVDRSITAPAPFVINNVNLILNLLEYSRQLDSLQLFLQISTDEVYGPAKETYLHKEWDTYFPSNPYSASKASQEAICYSYWRTFGLPIIISNTMNIIGERQDTEKFIPLVIRSLIQNSDVLIHAKKTDKGWIPGSRFYLHARNQADALKYILEKNASIDLKYTGDNSILEKFHIVGERELTNLQVVELISEYLGVKPRIIFDNFHASRPGHDLRYALDGSKLKHLGWIPPLPLEKSLEKVAQWYLNNTDWLEFIPS
jgi:dTDP-glucose 4,6-dehydratase